MHLGIYSIHPQSLTTDGAVSTKDPGDIHRSPKQAREKKIQVRRFAVP